MRPVRRCRYRLDDDIKMDLKERGCGVTSSGTGYKVQIYNKNE
jgi:hypothetical protein